MVVTDDGHLTERVGKFEFTVEFAEPSPQSRRRWDRRSDALTAWLLAEWRRQRKEALSA